MLAFLTFRNVMGVASVCDCYLQHRNTLSGSGRGGDNFLYCRYAGREDVFSELQAIARDELRIVSYKGIHALGSTLLIGWVKELNY